MDTQANRSRFWLVAVALVSAGMMGLAFVVQLDSTDVEAVNTTALTPIDRRVIVYLKSRRHIVTVYSTSDGPRFDFGRLPRPTRSYPTRPVALDTTGARCSPGPTCSRSSVASTTSSSSSSAAASDSQAAAPVPVPAPMSGSRCR